MDWLQSHGGFILSGTLSKLQLLCTQIYDVFQNVAQFYIMMP